MVASGRKARIKPTRSTLSSRLSVTKRASPVRFVAAWTYFSPSSRQASGGRLCKRLDVVLVAAEPDAGCFKQPANQRHFTARGYVRVAGQGAFQDARATTRHSDDKDRGARFTARGAQGFEQAAVEYLLHPLSFPGDFIRIIGWEHLLSDGFGLAQVIESLFRVVEVRFKLEQRHVRMDIVIGLALQGEFTAGVLQRVDQVQVGILLGKSV